MNQPKRKECAIRGALKVAATILMHANGNILKINAALHHQEEEEQVHELDLLVRDDQLDLRRSGLHLRIRIKFVVSTSKASARKVMNSATSFTTLHAGF